MFKKLIQRFKTIKWITVASVKYIETEDFSYNEVYENGKKIIILITSG